MIFAIVSNAAISPLPFQPFEIADIQYPANVLENWSLEELAAIGVYERVNASVAPAGSIVASTSFELRDGKVYEVAEYAPAPPEPVPAEVAMHRVKKAAVLTPWPDATNLLDAIYTAIDQLPEPSNKLAKIEFDSAPNLVRAGATTFAVRQRLGMTSAQMDDLLRFAVTLP